MDTTKLNRLNIKSVEMQICNRQETMFTHFIENAHVYILCGIIAAFILCEITKLKNRVQSMENKLQSIHSVADLLKTQLNHKKEGNDDSLCLQNAFSPALRIHHPIPTPLSGIVPNEYDGIFDSIESRFDKIETRLFHLSKSKTAIATCSEKKVIMDAQYERNEQIFKQFVEECFVLKKDAVFATVNRDISRIFRMWFGDEIGPTYTAPPTCELIKYLSRTFEWKSSKDGEGYWKGLRLK